MNIVYFVFLKVIPKNNYEAIMWGIIFIIFASLEFGIKIIFRWRTRFDKGIISFLFSALLIGFLFSSRADALYLMVHNFIEFPGHTIIVPSLFFILGLMGINPVLFAIFAGWAFPYNSPNLPMLIALPLILGNIPFTLFFVFTMPPRDKV